jgi:hypothetical protein
MEKKLSKNNSLYSSMCKQMPIFFDEIKNFIKKLNKTVHKQGFQNFYFYRSTIYKKQIIKEKIKENFEKDIKTAIKIVAVLRLAIDPFPILLHDEDILARFPESITIPYNPKLLYEYIGDEIISEYKKMDVYKNLYSEIMRKEKRNSKNDAFYRFHYLEIEDIEEIETQRHLLTPIHLLVLDIVKYSDKIRHIIYQRGFYRFKIINGNFTKNIDFNHPRVSKIDNSSIITNIHYKEDYFYSIICWFNSFFKEYEDIVIFHKNKLNKDEIKKLENINNINDLEYIKQIQY